MSRKKNFRHELVHVYIIVYYGLQIKGTCGLYSSKQCDKNIGDTRVKGIPNVGLSDHHVEKSIFRLLNGYLKKT